MGRNDQKNQQNTQQTNLEDAINQSSQGQEKDQERQAQEASKLNSLGLEIIEEAKKIAKNQTTSCYQLVELTKKYIDLEDFNS